MGLELVQRDADLRIRPAVALFVRTQVPRHSGPEGNGQVPVAGGSRLRLFFPEMLVDVRSEHSHNERTILRQESDDEC